MALSAKIFKLKEPLPLDIIGDKLRSYRRAVNVNDLELSYSFKETELSGNILRTIFVYDEIKTMNIKGELKDIIVTREAPVIFRSEADETLMIVLDKKFRANRIANRISEILFAKIGGIVEANIPHEVLKSLHEQSPEHTKVIYFDNVDIPNVDKLALYGDALADTSLYNMYLEHGKIWYVVFQHTKTGYIIGITRNMIIAMFSKVSIEEFINFIHQYIIPLLITKQRKAPQ